MKLNTVPIITSLAAVSAAAKPLTITLEGRRTTKRSSASDIELTSWHEVTDFQWYGKVSVGTPAQEFNLLFDTGSTDLIIPRKGCTTCSNYALYDTSKSSTYSNKPGYTFSAFFGTGGDSQPLSRPAAIHGHIVSDVVSIGGLSIENQTFLLANAYPTELGDNPTGPDIDGIFGLGPPGSSGFSSDYKDTFTTTFWNLVASESVPEPVFSFYLNAGADVAHGELTLGGTDPSKYEGELQKVDFNETVTGLVGEWFIDNPKFYVNNQSVKDSKTGDEFPGAVSLLDTGTAYIMTPDYQTAKDIYAEISPEIKQLDKLGSWGAPCDVMKKLSPQLTFTIGTGDKTINVTMAKDSFNLGEHDNHPGKCQGVILNSPEPISDLASIWVIGSPVLKNYYTVWDGANMQLGVAELKASVTGGDNGSSPTTSPTSAPTGGVRNLTPHVWGLAVGTLTLFLLL
ncbi:Fc.00g046330.m01.CDS01 [Cosmosporella sp. VM-42]